MSGNKHKCLLVDLFYSGLVSTRDLYYSTAQKGVCDSVTVGIHKLTCVNTNFQNMMRSDHSYLVA